jgi:hypothetical protein
MGPKLEERNNGGEGLSYEIMLPHRISWASTLAINITY